MTFLKIFIGRSVKRTVVYFFVKTERNRSPTAYKRQSKLTQQGYCILEVVQKQKETERTQEEKRENTEKKSKAKTSHANSSTAMASFSIRHILNLETSSLETARRTDCPSNTAISPRTVRPTAVSPRAISPRAHSPENILPRSISPRTVSPCCWKPSNIDGSCVTAHHSRNLYSCHLSPSQYTYSSCSCCRRSPYHSIPLQNSHHGKRCTFVNFLYFVSFSFWLTVIWCLLTRPLFVYLLWCYWHMYTN